MLIYHLSAECYPVAKAGGLGDVVGSLPKYLNNLDVDARVVMPRYRVPWIESHGFKSIYKGQAPFGNQSVQYEVLRETEDTLGFPLYVIDVPERFDRPGVYIDPLSGYGYWDEFERFLSFQIAFLEWQKQTGGRPDIIHCHDHHTALVPFMITRSFRYQEMQSVPTIVTVHNAEYHGEHEMSRYSLLPAFNLDDIGLLDWDGKLNSLAAGVKCAWRVTTVSPSYMKELQEHSGGLGLLFEQEEEKSLGIINGIDTSVWDPSSDKYLQVHYNVDSFEVGREDNKRLLCEDFDLEPGRPLISFIGRLVGEKGADLLADVIDEVLTEGNEVNFVILGTGNKNLHRRIEELTSKHVGFFDASLEYNERLAHQIYAGSDFLIMPSRVEPCGLNQMYSMRYGTVPIVRSTGGLIDTVKDLDEENGYGIRFDEFSIKAAKEAVYRAMNLYVDENRYIDNCKQLMNLDFSWNRSAKNYITLYKELAES